MARWTVLYSYRQYDVINDAGQVLENQANALYIQYGSIPYTLGHRLRTPSCVWKSPCARSNHASKLTSMPASDRTWTPSQSSAGSRDCHVQFCRLRSRKRHLRRRQFNERYEIQIATLNSAIPPLPPPSPPAAPPASPEVFSDGAPDVAHYV